jgi:hypothetical protein
LLDLKIAQDKLRDNQKKKTQFFSRPKVKEIFLVKKRRLLGGLLDS